MKKVSKKTDHWRLNVCGGEEEPAKGMEDW